MMASCARLTITGSAVPSPPETASLRRCIAAVESGPGISVAKWRDCGRGSFAVMPIILSPYKLYAGRHTAWYKLGLPHE